MLRYNHTNHIIRYKKNAKQNDVWRLYILNIDFLSTTSGNQLDLLHAS